MILLNILGVIIILIIGIFALSIIMPFFVLIFGFIFKILISIINKIKLINNLKKLKIDNINFNESLVPFNLLKAIKYISNQINIFTGGRDSEGETLAELFSFDQTLNGAFTPIPRTSINSAIQRKQSFQMASSMTDPETISRIGKQLEAWYIVAGSITRLGDSN